MQKKNKLANILMIVAITLIFAGGLLYVGNLQGWFLSTEAKAETVSVTETSGIISVEREAVAFTLENDAVIKAGDAISTEEESSASFGYKEIKFSTLDKVRLSVDKITGESVELTIENGDIIADSSGSETITINTNDQGILIENSAVTVSQQSGSTTINVLRGEVSTSEVTAKAGQSILIVEGKEEIGEATVASYSDMLLFEVSKYMEAGIEFIFSPDEITAEVEKRQAEQEALNEAGINGSLVPVGNTGYSGGETSSNEEGNVSKNGTENVKSCTITIRADTILNNMDMLATGKEVYVPANGIILATTTVEFTEGETVFDVLKRVSDYTGIQLEYSYFPIYESHYIEGINHLYEFDCGDGSGWNYTVNGWKPNYGVTKYTLQDGDNIKFLYTCNYGNDL